MDTTTGLSAGQRLMTGGLLLAAVAILAVGVALGEGAPVGLLLLPVAGCGAGAYLAGGRTVGTTVTIAVALGGAALLLASGATPAAAGMAALVVVASVVPVGVLAVTHLQAAEARADLDHATGLAGNHAIRAELDRARASMARREGHLAVLTLELPGLWAYADERGPAAGEQLLRTAAAGWSAALRPDDRLGRTRGARFLAVLPECHGDDALTVAQRLRAVAPGGLEVVVAGAAVTTERSLDDLLAELEDALVTAARWGDGIGLVSGAAPRPAVPMPLPRGRSTWPSPSEAPADPDQAAQTQPAAIVSSPVARPAVATPALPTATTSARPTSTPTAAPAPQVPSPRHVTPAPTATTAVAPAEPAPHARSRATAATPTVPTQGATAPSPTAAPLFPDPTQADAGASSQAGLRELTGVAAGLTPTGRPSLLDGFVLTHPDFVA